MVLNTHNNLTLRKFMNHYIKSIKIRNLFDEKDINWKLNRVNVLVGKNGLGKSTILHLINSAITQESSKYLNLCDDVMLEMKNNDKYHALKEAIPPDLLEVIIKELSTSDDFMNAIESSLTHFKEAQKFNTEIIKNIKKNIILDFKKKASIQDKNRINQEGLSSYKFGINVEPMETEFISTINMNANSVNNVTTSSGNPTTFLDFEISNEIKRLLDNSSKYPEKNLKEKLTNSLNNLFNETDKEIVIINNNLKVLLLNGKELSFKELSSGERQVVFIFLKVINASINNSLILMDEPEISLHLSWQEKLLDEINKVNSSSQIIIVTHSPAILMNGWFDCLTDIKDIVFDNIDSYEVD